MKERLRIDLDLIPQAKLDEGDFKNLQNLIKKGLKLDFGEEIKENLTSLQAELDKFLQKFDKSSPEFVDQKTSKEFKELYKEANKIFEEFQKIQQAAKNIKFSGNIDEFDKKIKEIAKRVAQMSEDLAGNYGLKGTDITALRTGKEFSQLGKERFEKSEFSMRGFEEKNNEVIKELNKYLVYGITSAETFNKRMTQLAATMEGFRSNISQANFKKLFEDSEIFKLDAFGENFKNARQALTEFRELIRAEFGTIKFDEVSLLGENSKLYKELQPQIAIIQKVADETEKLTKEREEEEAQVRKQTEAQKELIQSKAHEEVATKNLTLVKAEKTAQEKAEKEEREKNSESVQRLINKYLTLGTALALVKKAAKEAFKVLSDLDKAFTEMAIVTNYTNKQIWGFYNQFRDIASMTGFTTANIAGLTAEYLKQGETLSNSLILTEAAAKSAQVAGIDTADSVRYLTSAVRGYRLEAQDAMLVSDKFAAVAAATATDYEGIATAISKVAAQAYANGVEMDNLMGLLSTAMDVTQEAPENIGTAFKTIFARMSQISDYSKVLEDGTNMNKVEEALKLANVPLRDMEGNLRNLDDVLMDVGANWQTLNSTQKAFITNTLAGTRQQTRLLAVFENYDKLLENIETSQESAGATNAQQAKYMESLAAAQNEVAVAWGNFITSMANTDLFKATLRTVAEMFNHLSEAMKGWWGTFVLITAGLTSLVGAGKGALVVVKRLSAFINEGRENMTVFGRAIDLLSKGWNRLNTTSVAAAKGLKAAGDASALAGAKVATTGTTIMAVAGIAAAAVAGITLLVAAFKFLNVSHHEKIKKLNDELTKLKGNLYNIKDQDKSIRKLLEEYEELSKKVYKTNEDLEQQARILASIKDLDVNNEYSLETLTGELNREELDRFLEDNKKKQMEAEQEIADKNIEKFKNYLQNKEGLEQDSLEITDALLHKSFEGNMDKLKELDERARRNASNALEYIMDTATTTTTYSKSHAPVNRKALDMDMAQETLLKEFIEPMDKFYQMLEKGANMNLGEFIESLKLVFTEEELENLRTYTSELGQIENFANLDLNLNELQELSKVITIITDKTGELNDTQKLEITKAFAKGLGSGMDYLLSNLDKTGLSLTETTNLVRLLNKEITNIDSQNITDAMTGLETAAKNIEAASNAISNAEWNVEGLQKVLDLMTQYPQYSEDILAAIENEGELDQAVKEAMIENQKQLLIHQFDLQQIKLENDLQIAEAELELLNILLKDRATREEAYAQSSIDLDNAVANDVLDSAGFVSDQIAGVLQDRIRLYAEYQKEVVRLQKDADAGIISGSAAQLAAAFKPGIREITNVQMNLQAAGGSGYGNSATVRAMTERATKMLEAEQRKNAYDDAKFIELIKSAQVEKEAQIKGIKDQLALNEKLRGKIEGLKFEDFAGVADKESKATGGAKGGAGKSPKSGASEKAEYYLGILHKLYVAEQRVKAADLFMEKADNLRRFAESVEALGESFEGQREGYVTTAKVMQDQYGLYDVAAKQQEHLINVTREYQAALISGLEPALQRTFKVINGRIIPVSEEYGKLNAENMEIVDKMAEKFNDYADSIEKATQATIEYKIAQNEILNDMRDAVIEWQELIIEAIVNEEKRYIDSFKKLIEANKKYLSERKKLYENSFKEEDTDRELGKIEEQRLDLSEKIAALEGAHDQVSLRRKEEYRKELQDLNERFTEITLQYNRDAFLQRIDEQVQYQDEVFAREEEAYNERISNAEWLEERIRQITDDAKAYAIVTEMLHNKNIEDLIREGYISREDAVKLGLEDIDETVNTWNEDDKGRLISHLANNNDILNKAWGEGTDPSNPGAEGIVKAAGDRITTYLTRFYPDIEGKTSTMKEKLVADWQAITKAAMEYTRNFDGLTLKAPDYSALSTGLRNIVNEIKSAADSAEREYARLKVAQQKPSSTSGGGGSSGSGGGTSSSGEEYVAPKPPAPKYPAVMYGPLSYGRLGSGSLRTTIASAKSAYPGQDIYSWNRAGGETTNSYTLGSRVYTARKSSGGGGGGGMNIPSATMFATGGTTERTGFHWLDGQPGKPERVLSPGQNREFEALLKDLAVESKLRVESYMNSDGMRDFGMSFAALSEIGQKLYEGNIRNTDELVHTIVHSSSRIERTLKEGDNQQNDIFKTLTMNKKY